MDMYQSNMAFKASSSGSRLHNFMQVQNPMAPQTPQSTHELNSVHSEENLQQRQARMQQLTNHHLALFWRERLWEMDNMVDHRQHMLPLARIKKVMKSDDEVKMISADAPMLFSKAAEMFILELTLRSWMHTETGNRRTLQQTDVANAISDTQVFDFLLDIVPREEDEEDEAPENQAMPPQNVNYFHMLSAHLAQQQLNASEQMTDRNAARDTHVMPSGMNFAVLTPNPLSMSSSPNQFTLAPPSNQFSLAPLPSQLSLSSTKNEDLMLGNSGGESSRRSPGTSFPFLDAERYHFNYNPVTDEEMANRPGVEMQSEPPSGGFLGMLGLNSFNNDVNFPQNRNP